MRFGSVQSEFDSQHPDKAKMKISIRKLAIPFFVFVTGACVLIIEITAIRVLSPYFGNTIFTVSSVISVVLLALSLGYYSGGKLADKYPQEKLFYSIITISGVAVILLHLFGMAFLSVFGYKLSIKDGPLISSILLFFLQIYFLGMLSPFAIKLQKMRLEETGIGSVSGEIFFWSTLGSIFGSLSAGFFLIPNFEINKIIFGTGFVLIALGILGILKTNYLAKFFLAVVMAFVILSFPDISETNSKVVYSKNSLYQKIVIFDEVQDGKKFRFLLQDRNLSGGQLVDYDELVFDYTKYYALYQILNPDVKTALTIGGGAYSIPKAILKDIPKAQVDVVEIDPVIYDLGKKYFRVSENDKIINFVQDGRRFLHDSDKKYDLIFSDAYSSLYSMPEHLTTKEFFKIAKEKLNDKGVFIANVIGSLPAQTGLSNKKHSFVLSEIKTFQSVFENSYFFAVKSPNSTEIQNLIFVGYNADEVVDFESAKIKKNKNPIISGLSEKRIDLQKFNLDSYPLLTDNFAPVEYLISKEF